ncbi:MAG: hypothetical protein PUC15_01310 [Lentisphaeria bacterium]|nr:hypothetical protein [Lentisphaeria bacterium]
MIQAFLRETGRENGLRVKSFGVFDRSFVRMFRHFPDFPEKNCAVAPTGKEKARFPFIGDRAGKNVFETV